MKYNFLLVLIFICFAETTNAQVTDLARLEFTYFPQSNSENSFRRFRTFVNVPLKVSEDGYLVPGIGYRNIHLRLDDEFPFINRDLERYHSINASVGFTDKLENDWRYGIQGGVILASNLAGKIENDDFIFEGAAFFIKDKTGPDENFPSAKPWRLILGAAYSTTAGRPFPLPIINYYREFAPKWSFAVGVPKTNVKHRFNEQHAINAFATLDGFFANIQGNVAVANDPTNSIVEIGENISMTTVLSGLGYEYCFTKHLIFYIYGGWTILNDIRLRDGDGNDVFTINDTNNIYARSGVKFKL